MDPTISVDITRSDKARALTKESKKTTSDQDHGSVDPVVQCYTVTKKTTTTTYDDEGEEGGLKMVE